MQHELYDMKIAPGRKEIESVNKPASVGGVLVNPGDKATRLILYKSLGMPLDKSVLDEIP